MQSSDGTVRTLSSLKELQRLITAGSLSEDDLIARGDEDYKRLGDIAELSTFFAAAAAGNADTEVNRGRRKRKGTTPGMTAAPMDQGLATAETTIDPRPDQTLPEPPRAPPPRRQQNTILGVGGAAAQSPVPERPGRPPPKAARPPAPTKPLPTPAQMGAAETMPASPSARPAQRPAAPRTPPPQTPIPPTPAPPRQSDRPLYLDDEPVVPARGRSRSGLWVALVMLLAGGVGVALGWPQIAPMLGLAEAPSDANPAEPHITAGDEALAEDTVEGYETALHSYLQALAHDDHEVEVLTRISRANALWAQALHFDASDLEASAEEDPTRRGEANAIRREQERKAATALEHAENAVRYGSGNATAEVALSDALRLTNDPSDLQRSRSRLERALTLDSQGSAETLRVQALVAVAEAGGDLAVARDFAEQAVSEDPSSIRARLLYARALLAARQVSEARSQVDAILRRDARHPRAVALRDAIENGQPPAPPTVDVPDGGLVEAPVEEPGGEPTEAPTEEVATTGGAGGGRRGGGTPAGGGGGRVPANRDYSWYVRRGDELLGRNDLPAAREHFDAARAERPGGSEALNGLGQVMLRQGDAAGAAGRFRQAAGQGYGEAYIGLGQAYRRMGRNSDALTSFERYIQRMPSGPHASLARRQIEELQASSGGGGGGGGGGEPDPTPPPTEGDQLPPPENMETPPPEDVPAIDSEP